MMDNGGGGGGPSTCYVMMVRLQPAVIDSCRTKGSVGIGRKIQQGEGNREERMCSFIDE